MNDDIPHKTPPDHAWTHDQLAAYLAGGLDPAERQRFDSHVNACPDCFDAFTEARDADRAFARALAPLLPAEKFEDRLITTFREKSMKSRLAHTLLRRTAYAAAACLALAATGVFANYAINHGGALNNPLTDRLIAQANAEDKSLADPLANLRGLASSAPVAAWNEILLPAEGPKYRGAFKDTSDQLANLRSKTAVQDPNQPSQSVAHATLVPSMDSQNSKTAGAGKYTALQGDLQTAANIDQQKAMQKQVANAEELIPPPTAYKDLTLALSGNVVSNLNQKTSSPTASGTSPQLGPGTITDDGLVTQLKLAPQVNLTDDARAAIRDEAKSLKLDDGKYEFSAGNTPTAGVVSGATSPVGVEFGSNNFHGKDYVQANADPSIEAFKTNKADVTDIRFKLNEKGADQKLINLTDAEEKNQAAKGLEGDVVADADNMDLKARRESGADYSGGGGGGAVVGGTGGRGGAAGRGGNAGVALGLGGPAGPAARPVIVKADTARATTAPALSANEDTSHQREPGTLIAAAPTTQPAAPPPQPSPAEIAQRKIIRNGTVEFEVRSFEDTYTTVSNVVAEEAGFVSSTSSDKLANGKVRGSIVVRLPPEHLERFLMKIRALGELKSQQIGATDVTKEFTDIESELRGLRVMEGRLIDLIKNGKGEVKDLVEAEKQLGDYRIRIEKLEGEIRYYNNLVGLATLTITAYEKDIQKPTAAAEQENVNLSVETEEVESKYQAARKVLDDAKARIVESQLKNADADHFAALIVADVAPDKADFVAAQLKQLGKVASFTRDRRQTTTGGTGVPDVEVEHKDTRFSISMYNLANLAPRETTVLAVAVQDVEGAYRKILGQVRQVGAPQAAGEKPAPDANPDKESHPTGRVLSSALNGQQPDQMSADLQAEVRADQADAVLQAIRDTGEVITSSLAVNPDNAQSTAAKRGIQLRLVNIAAVPPKETVTMNIAVRDVEATAAKIRTLVERTSAGGPPSGNPPRPVPASIGRIQASVVNGQQPEQMTADIRAEVPADQADLVLSAIRDTGEVMSSVSATNPDPINVTPSKRGIVLRLINVAAVAPRETQALHLVAADVTDSYNKLLNAIQTLAKDGNARILNSALNQSDPRTINATLQFEARREVLPAIEKAFADAGVDFVTRTINHSANTINTLDTKILFVVETLRSAESLEPRRTFTLSREVDNVEAAMDKLRGGLSGTAVHETDFNTQNVQGRVTGHIVLESPTASTMSVLAGIRDLGGVEKDNQVTKNAQVPETRFSRDRIDLNLINKPKTEISPLVPPDQGLGPTIRAALSRAAGALLFSLYLIVIGIAVLAPFALIVWPFYTLIRRRRAATPTP